MSAIGGTPNQWGVTPPISISLPTDVEKKASEALLEELKRGNNYPSAEEDAKRYVVYRFTQILLSEKVRTLLIPPLQHQASRIFTKNH